LLVPDELAALALDRLQNHIVADDVAFHQETTGSMVLALGPATAQLAASCDHDSLFPLSIFGQRGFVTWSSEPVDLPPLSPEEMAWRRIISGFPRWGLDVKAGQLVTETTLVDIAVAHRKGCYLGQETVHKIQTRRGAAFAPMALEAVTEIADPESFPGRSFTIGEDKGGKVFDWAIWDDQLVFEVSLHRIHRIHRVDGIEASCLFDDGRLINGRVRRLPMLEVPSPQTTTE
jgi:folate-binding protein YgfZ